MGQTRPPFYEIASQLDGLAQVEEPSNQQVNDVLELLRDDAYARYFFYTLGEHGNVGWLSALDSAGVFDEPPAPVAVGEGMVKVPVWAASDYLRRIGGKAPEQVLRIAKRIRTDNYHVIVDLLSACLDMSASTAAKIVPMVDEWIDIPYLSLIPPRVGDLLSHLLAGGEWNAALKLVEILTRPLAPPKTEEKADPRLAYFQAQSRFEKTYFQSIMRGQVLELAKAKPVEVLRLLEAHLRLAIRWELERSRTEKTSDESPFWRPAIESHEQNYSRAEFKNVVVETIRDLAEEMAVSEPVLMQEIIARWLVDEYSIFRRVAIHVVRTHPERYDQYLTQLLGTRANLYDAQIHHEFYLLMESSFDKVALEVQHSMLEWIMEGEPADRLEWSKQLYKGRTGKDAPDETVQTWKEYWSLSRLWALRSYDLPADYASELDRLVAKMGMPEHPDFLVYSTTSWGRTERERVPRFERMSVDEVIKFLLTWQPSDDGFPDIALGRIQTGLERVPTSRPRAYSWALLQFVKPGPLRESYLQYLLWGLHEAWAAGKHLSWEPILEACSSVVDWREEGADEIRRRVVDLLTTALRRPDHFLPRMYMRQARDLLLKLIDDPDPRPEDEEDRLERYPDPLTVAINSVRGKTLEALLDYARRHKALWRDEPYTYGRYAPSPDPFDHRVRQALDERLSEDESLAIRSVFGERLILLFWFDKDWTQARIPRIFPAELSADRIWKAAWDAYVSFNKVWVDVYQTLRPQYRRAIEELGTLTREGEKPPRSASALAQHLMAAYWVRLEELDDPTGLLQPFYEVATDELRSDAVWALWRILAEQKPSADSVEWQRLKRLWQLRIEAANKADEPQLFANELLGFIHWLDSVPEGLPALFPMIQSTIPYYESPRGPERYLPEFLQSQVAEHPALASQLFLELIMAVGEQSYMLLERDVTRTILQKAMDSNEADAISFAVEAINLLGELGAWEYRDLLRDNE